MANEIFRQDALDRLKSPEQLNDVVQVVPPSSWLVLLGIGILVTATLIWACAAYLPVKVDGYGFLRQASDGRLVGVAYVSVLDVPKIQPGMKTEMMMSHVRSEQHGYLLAHVGQVAQTPSHDVPEFIRQQIRVEAFAVTILPTTQWSGPPPRYGLHPDIFFHALVTVDQIHPIDYVMPIFRRFL